MATDLLQEAAETRDAFTATPTLMGDLSNVVSGWHLAQTLFALWDCGGYDFVRAHDKFTADELCRGLNVSHAVLVPCLEYLVGHGIFGRVAGHYSLTRKGRAFHNVFLRGMLDMYVGGYRSILSRLPELLRNEQSLEEVSRSTRHAAAGTERINCLYTIPRVITTLQRWDARHVLDLGCGTGGFLLQAARLSPALSGVGVDASGDAVAEAQAAAGAFAMADRLRFYEALVGTTPIDLPAREAARVDCVTAMFMLHEFGRDGREQIVAVIRSLRAQFPGRRFVFVECDPAEPAGIGALPGLPTAPLDYQLVHPLSLQGSPRRKDDWWSIVEEAGGTRLLDEKAWGGSFMRIYSASL